MKWHRHIECAVFDRMWIGAIWCYIELNILINFYCVSLLTFPSLNTKVLKTNSKLVLEEWIISIKEQNDSDQSSRAINWFKIKANVKLFQGNITLLKIFLTLISKVNNMASLLFLPSLLNLLVHH